MKVHTINGTCYVKCIDVNALEQDLEATERQVCILSDGLSKCEKKKERIKEQRDEHVEEIYSLECLLVRIMEVSNFIENPNPTSINDSRPDQLVRHIAGLSTELDTLILNLATAVALLKENSEVFSGEGYFDDAAKCDEVVNNPINLNIIAKIQAKEVEGFLEELRLLSSPYLPRNTTNRLLVTAIETMDIVFDTGKDYINKLINK